MTERQFHKELQDLKAKLIEMSFKVEESVARSCDALFERNMNFADEVLRQEALINKYEVEVDEIGHSLFATGQPLAIDLRLMTMILKINTDLERIGDHAVNIAEGCLFILQEKEIPIDGRLNDMSIAVQGMFRDAMDCFIREDVELAKSVLKRDDEIDRYHYELFNDLRAVIEKKPETVNVNMNLIMISHNLERIADLTNNIAEDIIYWKQGREVRHQLSGESSGKL